MMDEDFSRRVEDWARRAVEPVSGDCEEAQSMPPALLRGLGEQGLDAACIPVEYGGKALDSLTLGQVSAHLGQASASLMSVFVVHAMVAQALARFGDEAQKRVILPQMASGALRAAFALTEPDFGSDAGSIACAARRVPEGFVLDGEKKWISAAVYADLFLVLARLGDEGLAAFLAPAATPGLTIIPLKNLLGFRAAGIARLRFENCLLPTTLPLGCASLVEPVGGGFSFIGAHALDTGRFVVGWAGVGILAGALEASARYACAREQFGQALEKHQLIREMIADMATDLAAARALAEQAAAAREAALPDAVMRVTTAKYFSSRAANRAAAAALQLHGGNGCSAEFPVARYFRDAKILEIIEGSSQMQQLMISSAALMQGRRKKRHG
jgi:alkylation response protein AidB-like acyl-CoA dehydrogenase